MYNFTKVTDHNAVEIERNGEDWRLKKGKVRGVLTGGKDNDGQPRHIVVNATEPEAAYKEAHEAAIKRALRYNQHIPEDVRKDYSWLQPLPQDNLFDDSLFKAIPDGWRTLPGQSQNDPTAGNNSIMPQITGMSILLVRHDPFARFMSKAVDDDHIQSRRAEVKKCCHVYRPCKVKGINGFLYPAKYCGKCGSVKMHNIEHHGWTSNKAPMSKAIDSILADIGNVVLPITCGADLEFYRKLHPNVSLSALSKAVSAGCYKDPKSCGLRWITAHPNGDNGDGIPLLVHDNGDEYTVVGGAGGKMNQQVFKIPKGQQNPKAAIRKEKRLEKKRAMLETLGEKGAQMRENAEALKAAAKEQQAALESRVLDLIHGSMEGAGALDALQDEARKRALKENAKATPEEQEEFADQAATAAKTEAKGEAKRLLSTILDRAAMRALGDDDGSSSEFEAKLNGKQLIKKLPQDAMDQLVQQAASIAETKAKAKAIMRALSTGDQDTIQGIEADVRPLSMEEAHQKNLDRYLNEQDVDNQTALVQQTNQAPDITRKRNQANGAMDGLNSFVSSITGKAILRPELVKSLGVEDAARVAAAYLTENGVDAQTTAEGLRDRIGNHSAASVAAAIDKVREMDAIVDHAKAAANEGGGDVTTAQASILAANMASQKYRFLNVTRGQLRAGAALAHHLEHPSQRPMEINGGSSATAAHAAAKGMGLGDGDYQVHKAAHGEGGGYRISVPADKLGKMAKPHGQAESDRNLAMDQLRQDVEENPGQWQPQGGNPNILLQKHQELGARSIIQNKHMILNMGAGSGKTPTAYSAMADLLSSGKIDRALMSMPAKVKAQQEDYTDGETGEKKTGEASKFLSEDMKKGVMVATSSNFDKCLKAVKSGECKILVVSPDMLRNKQKELQEAGFGGERSAFIADEAHKFAVGQTEGEGSGMAKASKAFSNSEYAVHMSGTLIENNASELWSSLDSLYPGQFGGQKQFTEEWQRLAQGSGNLFTSEAMKGMRDRLSGSMVTYHKPVKGPSGEPITLERNTVTVKATAAQKAAIAKINETYKKERASADPQIAKAAALRRYGSSNRILSAGVKVNGKLENPKLEALQKIMADEKARDPKNRVGIYSKELAPQRAAGEALKGHKLARIVGEDDDKATQTAIKSVNDRNNDTDGLTFTDAAATGTNLQGLDHIVKMAPLDVPSLEDQIDHRHFRGGQTRNVRATVLMTDHPVEQVKQFRTTRVKLPEIALLSTLADDSGMAGVLARNYKAIEQAATGVTA